MRTLLQLRVDPVTAGVRQELETAIRAELGLSAERQLNFRISRRSIDARGRKILVNLSLDVAVDEPLGEHRISFTFRDVSKAPTACHIVGMGPGGLFAALRCLEMGIKPVLFERGKEVQPRRRDLVAITRQHLVNPESNYCFGEGGAGTYSDGKLYTRSGKRGDVERILKLLVYHGAGEEILADAHPHIGTNKLPLLIRNIRETILRFGGEVYFETKLTDINVADGLVRSIIVKHGEKEREENISSLILATGHSARDVYEILHRRGLQLESKPFAAGVRVEHPQDLIDSIQYHCAGSANVRSIREYLPAASYSLVHQVKNRGVYSFCMCPGGIIAPCATAQEEIVTNGWSPSKRNNPFANSGIVVSIGPEETKAYDRSGAFAGLEFQKEIERRAWVAGGRTQAAPAVRLVDFIKGRSSSSLPACSYTPGIIRADLDQVLGRHIAPALREGFKAFGGKMRGFLSHDAVLVGVESRTSTPVRIPRDKELLFHPGAKNLFPCAEGAGYAGGIVSAAMDGERCAMATIQNS